MTLTAKDHEFVVRCARCAQLTCRTTEHGVTRPAIDNSEIVAMFPISFPFADGRKSSKQRKKSNNE